MYYLLDTIKVITKCKMSNVNFFLIACVFFTSVNVNEIKAQNEELNFSTLKWKFKSKEEGKWYPAVVPGTIHSDLITNHLLENPFFGTNEKKSKWVEEKTWIYETQFTLNEKQFNYKKTVLNLEGIDTYSSVYLNNELICETKNMFVNYTINIKTKLRIGENNLRIEFPPQRKIAQTFYSNNKVKLPGEERVYIRKAQYHFGWDWAPDLLTCGIWKNGQIQFQNEIKIQDVHFSIKNLNFEKAEIEFITQFDESTSDNAYSIEYEINGPNHFIHKIESKIAKDQKNHQLKIEIPNPQLWWCNERGKQNLYTAKFTGKQNKQIIQEKFIHFGLRNFELIQTKDFFGNSFQFKLNGSNVFAKGANIIPLDIFLPEVKKEEYKKLIDLAVKAHMNTIRVWGGGVYENDAFYTLCDSAGIMVWQDFMFACAMYPGDRDFIDNIKNEIKQQVTRLRNHPSLVLWCGNNEIIEGWNNWGWQKQYGYNFTDSLKIINDYNNLFKEVIPAILKEYDPQRPYHPSSPANGWGRKESYLVDDVHYWGVWWGLEPFENYEQKTGRFVSEYGFQSVPLFANLKKFIPENDLFMNSESMKSHQKHPTGYETIRNYLQQYFPETNNLEAFSYFSQLLQAKAMKIAIESHRKKMPYCSGSLFWQLNDCWPVVSWSCIDHFGTPKAAYYQIKQSFNPCILSFGNSKNELCVYGINDGEKEINASLLVDIYSESGEKIYSETKEVKIKENESMVLTLIHELYSKNKDIFINAKLTSKEENKTIFQTTYFLKPEKELKLKEPNLQIKKLNSTSIEILCPSTFAKGIYLQANGIEFEENYFDMYPGEKRIIKLANLTASAWSEQSIRVKSLIDFMK